MDDFSRPNISNFYGVAPSKVCYTLSKLLHLRLAFTENGANLEHFHSNEMLIMNREIFKLLQTIYKKNKKYRSRIYLYDHRNVITDR